MTPSLTDGFGRSITYLRLSVTDRCDLRCTYCMPARMEFLPRADLLSIEELDRVASAFIDRGVNRLRITGGEPLVRRGLLTLIGGLSRHLDAGTLDEITLTTNATLLAAHAKQLAAAGVRRINVSLDSIDPVAYRQITRGGDVRTALLGIEAANQAGIAVKINTVALADQNADQIVPMIEWAHAQGHALTLIEVMPTAETGEDRWRQYLPLAPLRRDLEKHWTLTQSAARTGGPARYYHVAETGGTLGFIAPMTGNFCDGCNRVRVTCTGQLVLCLGQETGADLRAPLRQSEADDTLGQVIDAALPIKPMRHGFEEAYAERRSAVARTMSVTGG